MSKHTPGPWRYNCDGEGRKIMSADGGTVARLSHLAGPYGTRGRKSDSEVIANGHMIAAAPLMYEALERIAKVPDCGCWPCRSQCESVENLRIDAEEIRELARAALQAAKGGENA